MSSQKEKRWRKFCGNDPFRDTELQRLGLSYACTAPLVNGPVYAILQATIAPDYQGRVFALVGSLAGAAAPLGLIVAAPVAEITGVGVWYLAGGIACVAMGIGGFFAPALMGIEDGTAGPVASMCAEAPSGR